jgi:hypothetical protein
MCATVDLEGATPRPPAVATFSDLLARLDLDLDPRLRGKQFKHVCKWFLTNDPTYAARLRSVWLWKQWPDGWSDIDAWRQSSAGLQPPADYEKTGADQPVAAYRLGKTCPSWGQTDHRGHVASYGFPAPGAGAGNTTICPVGSVGRGPPHSWPTT